MVEFYVNTFKNWIYNFSQVAEQSTYKGFAFKVHLKFDSSDLCTACPK